MLSGSNFKRRLSGWPPRLLLPLLLFSASPAHASIFHGETLDKVADVLTWIVLIIAPIVAIGVFLLLHIMPEKIAEKKHHPQTPAIQCLCLLSLFFGGLLWPLAWLWAYTKPVLHQVAYGTDKAIHDKVEDEEKQLKELRKRLAELETKMAAKAADKDKEGKA